MGLILYTSISNSLTGRNLRDQTRKATYKKGTRQKEKLFCQAHERVTNSDYLSVCYRHQMHQCYMNALPTCLHVTNNVTKIYELVVTRVFAQKSVTKDPNTRTNCLATHKERQ